MRQKRIEKKLTLNKKTIANLNGEEMSIAKGGKAVPTGSVCETECNSVCLPTCIELTNPCCWN